MKYKFLFITRNYPPKIGGLEVYSYNLIKAFEKNHIVFKIVLSRSIIHIVWFLPYSFFTGLYLGWKKSIQFIHLCDGLLAPIGILLLIFTRATISISIHGLDITYRNAFYQLLIPWCVARLDKVICVSHSTLHECKQRGIPSHKCTVIPNGICPDEIYLSDPRNGLRDELAKIVGTSFQNKSILVTVGRLVKRKGVAWFVSNVMPCLDTCYSYLIVGDGPEYERIHEIVAHHNLDRRVFLLGKVSNEDRNLALNASDIFIMPNITDSHDIEGFGIAAIEAGSCGLPVIASNVQGIRDAVIDGKTGILVEEGDVNGFLSAIKNMSLKRAEIRSVVNSTFSWLHIYQHYFNHLVCL